MYIWYVQCPAPPPHIPKYLGLAVFFVCVFRRMLVWKSLIVYIYYNDMYMYTYNAQCLTPASSRYCLRRIETNSSDTYQPTPHTHIYILPRRFRIHRMTYHIIEAVTATATRIYFLVSWSFVILFLLPTETWVCIIHRSQDNRESK